MNNGDLTHLVDGVAEGVVIGTILRCGDSVYREVEHLAVDDFGIEVNRIVFAAIQSLAGEVDPTFDAVVHRLDETGKLQAAGGFEGLLRLHRDAIPGSPMSGFAKSLRKKNLTRTAWRLNRKFAAALTSGAQPGDEELLAIAAELSALGDSSADDARRILRVEDLPPIGEDLDPVVYFREPELPAGSVVALTGDSGSGKSTLVTGMARDCIATGRPVLFLDRESPRAFVLDRMNRLGLADGPLLRWWGGWLGEVPSPASAVVHAYVRDADPKPLVVTDSLAAFLQGDENDASVMRQFMHRGPRRLADLGATVVVIHHDGKAETARDYRGSSDFKASVDVAFHVTNLAAEEMKLDRMTLRCYKSRYGFGGSLVYHYADGLFVRDERRDAAVRTVADQLTGLLRLNPGIGAKAFEELAVEKRLGRQRARDFVNDGVLGGLIRRETTGRNQHRLTLVERS